jgi:hypothetical protein
MLQKNEKLLKELEGLTEEQCIQWFLDHYSANRNEAKLDLAVARGQEVYGDIIYRNPRTGKRRYDYGAYGLLTDEILEHTQGLSEEEAIAWYMTAYDCDREQALEGLQEARQEKGK